MKNILESFRIKITDFSRMWRAYRATGVWPKVVARVGQPQKAAR